MLSRLASPFQVLRPGLEREPGSNYCSSDVSEAPFPPLSSFCNALSLPAAALNLEHEIKCRRDLSPLAFLPREDLGPGHPQLSLTSSDEVEGERKSC